MKTSVKISPSFIEVYFNIFYVIFYFKTVFCLSDLKPDNIGFTADMQLKIFDFGLVSCVKKRTHPSEVYEMTGYSGSVRYMAPRCS